MRKEPKCSSYDLRALEAWLAQCARDGEELTDEWKEFREGEKREKRFCIEPAEKSDGPSQSMRDSRALMGWEYVCSMDEGAFYVWRSVEESATPPRPRELAGSWADRRLGRQLLYWWLGTPAVLAIPIGTIAFFFGARDMPTPLCSFLTSGSTQISLLTTFFGLVCGFWATRREHRNLRRLRRAVRTGEYLEPIAQHTVWYETMRWLPLAAVLLFLIPLVRYNSGEVEPAARLFLTAEALGGETGARSTETLHTPLCDTVVVREGETAELDSRGGGRWRTCATQLEVYRPRLRMLTKPLMRELARNYGMAQAEPLDGADDAYYRKADGVQYLLLRGGGTALFYRTDAPDDPRARADELSALLAAYR